MPDGILIIDKTKGITSHDVVARLRRLLKTKKIGHTGTLDPFATGVLVMMVGKATRLMRFLHADEKEYEAVARFGYETDTGDATGEPRGDRSGDLSGELQFAEQFVEKIKAVLPEFTSEIEQIPPMYSAKKIGGERLYKLAREGKVVAREPVRVTISELECTGAIGLGDGTLDIGLRVTCSAGTYVRTLAEDIGKRIGVGCHLAELRRTKAGRFALDQAMTLDEIEAITESGGKVELLSPVQAVTSLPSVELSPGELKRVSNGMSIKAENGFRPDAGEVALLSEQGELAAIAEYDAGTGEIKPRLVVI